MQADLEEKTEVFDIKRSTSSGFWSKEPASGDYGLVINGHSLVRWRPRLGPFCNRPGANRGSQPSWHLAHKGEAVGTDRNAMPFP